MTLTEYFKTAFDLERSIYEQNRLINQTRNKINDVQHPKYLEKQRYISYSWSDFETYFWITFCGAFVGFIIGFIVSFVKIGIWKSLWYTSGWGSAFKGALIAGILTLLATFLYEVYGNMQIPKINKETDAFNAMVDISNEMTTETSNVQTAGLNALLSREIAFLNQTQNVLNQFYGLNVIYPKYRNFVSVATIYEYLASGICTELGGPDGAYRFYEEELRAQRILAKLDEIIVRLDKIIDNQQMLAAAIRDSNRRIDQLGQSISYSISSINDNIENGIERISNNQQVGNFFGAISAANTSYLAKIERERQQ